jgi:hypothetical protein
VSGVGDDVNPCSRTAPCKTFAGAISKTADKGEIDALDPGGFGAVTITKSITIDGGGTLASILAVGTNGVNVNDSASGAPGTIVVRLRNLSINGAGTGIHGVNFVSGKALSVENCYITGFTQQGINASLNLAVEVHLRVTDTMIESNSGNGLRTSNAQAAFVRTTLTRVNFQRNGTGVTAADNSLMLATDSHVASSINNGWLALPTAGGPAQITLAGCSSSNNGAAGAAAQNATAIVRFDNSMMDHNAGAGIVSVAGGQLLSFGNNRSVANGGGDGAATGTAVTVF